MKNIYGEYKETFLVPNTRIYFGKKEMPSLNVRIFIAKEFI